MIPKTMHEQLKQAAEIIHAADSLLITAGAGMGVDSGMPDFRGNEGFWRAYPTFKARGLSFVDLANPQWFYDDPAQAWGFYGHRFNLYRSTRPHKGFNILRRWQLSKPAPGFVFTSNVDGHFQQAGFAESHMLECHGAINHWQCLQQCTTTIWPATFEHIVIDNESLRAEGELPRCPHCDGLARPNILMFGDFGWTAARAQQQEDRYRHWRDSHANTTRAVIELGAGTAIPTVRYESEYQRVPLIRINPRESQGPRQTVSLAMPALEALQAIDDLL